MASRGGYGMTRCSMRSTEGIARSVSNGTRWSVQRHDHAADGPARPRRARHRGPGRWPATTSAAFDGEGGVDDITRDCFVEAMTSVR